MTAVETSEPEARARSVSCAPCDVDTGAAQAEAATTLRRLIDEAETVSGRLRELVGRGAGNEPDPDGSSDRLHQRLRLGARMLMAFQAQIDRAEDTVRDLEARLESRREMLQQVEERLAALTGRLEGLLERAEGAEVNLAAMVRRARPEPDGPALLITLPESVTSSDETAV